MPMQDSQSRVALSQVINPWPSARPSTMASSATTERMRLAMVREMTGLPTLLAFCMRFTLPHPVSALPASGTSQQRVQDHGRPGQDQASCPDDL